MIINIDLDNATGQKVKRIIDHSTNKNALFEGLIEYQINDIKKGIINIKKDLSEYESMYNMSSEEFNKKMSRGELDDNKDFVIWSGIYEGYLEYIEKLKEFE